MEAPRERYVQSSGGGAEGLTWGEGGAEKFQFTGNAKNENKCHCRRYTSGAKGGAAVVAQCGGFYF
jgi:hypothetical protein